MAMPSQMPITPNSRGTPPALAHAGLDGVDDAAQVHVTGDDFAEGVGDADERPFHLGVTDCRARAAANDAGLAPRRV